MEEDDSPLTAMQSTGPEPCARISVHKNFPEGITMAFPLFEP